MKFTKPQVKTFDPRLIVARFVRRLDRSINSQYYLFDDKTSPEDSPLEIKISTQSITLELNSLLENKNVTKEVKSLKSVG